MKDARGTFASLSSSLLARKGQARPAMRPNSGQSLEDLGWNDHGHEVTTPVVPVEPTPIRYQAAITASFSRPEELIAHPSVGLAEDAPEIELKVSSPTAPRRTRGGSKRVKASTAAHATVAIGKAAFTLRLDEERHLRLRLACAMLNRSGQQVVTEALEQYLAGVQGLGELAERMPSKGLKGHN